MEVNPSIIEISLILTVYLCNKSKQGNQNLRLWSKHYSFSNSSDALEFKHFLQILIVVPCILYEFIN